MAPLGVQHRGRFVQDDAVGAGRQRARDGDPLLLTAGEHVRRVVAVRRHPDDVQRLIHPPPDLCRWDAQILRPEGHVLLHRARDQLIVGVLEDHAHSPPDRLNLAQVGGGETVHPDLPGGGEEERVEVAGQGGFPRPVGPDEGDELPPPDRQVNPPQGRDGPAVLSGVDVLQVEGLDEREAHRET